MMRITVFTPAYNRGYIIHKLYHSLRSQTFHDFEWMIVDDGSTDDTRKIVQGFMEENQSFPISYLYVPNGGKHRAINIGVKSAKGELFFIVDSDDYLTNTALEIIDSVEKQIPVSQKKKFAGVCGLRGYNMEKMIGTTFPGDILDITILERNKYQISGDKSEVFYTHILKQYPFPEFENEKFVTECVIWDQIAHDGYKLRFFNRITYICNYLEDGLTANYQKMLAGSPKGYGLYIHQCDRFHKISGLEKWKEYYRYYRQERNFLRYSQMSEYLHMNLFKFYFLIAGMRLFCVLEKIVRRFTI